MKLEPDLAALLLVCLAGSSVGAVLVWLVSASFSCTLQPGQLSRFIGRRSEAPQAARAPRLGAPIPVDGHSPWADDLTPIFARPEVRLLPLDLLAATALAFVRADRSNPCSLTLSVFVFYAHHAAGPLLASADHARLVAFVGRHAHALGDMGDLLLPILHERLQRHGDLETFRMMLELHWRQSRFSQIVRLARRFQTLARQGEQALAAEPSAADATPATATQNEALAVAELVAAGFVGTDSFEAGSTERPMLRLLARSSERYLPKVKVAHFLCEHLDECVDPPSVVRAIEQMPPRSWDDYSNFQEVFSLKTWPTMRRLLARPEVVNELDRFVTYHDRRGFWWRFNNAEGHA